MEVQEALKQIQEDYPHIQTQAALADLVGLSGPMINTYLKGISRPNLTNAARIWGRFNIQCEPFTEEALQKEWEMLNK